MNREAAVLGTPAYTVFAGKPGAVDDDLIHRGMLRNPATPSDIEFVRKNPDHPEWFVENRRVIINELLAMPRH